MLVLLLVIKALVEPQIEAYDEDDNGVPPQTGEIIIQRDLRRQARRNSNNPQQLAKNWIYPLNPAQT